MSQDCWFSVKPGDRRSLTSSPEHRHQAAKPQNRSPHRRRLAPSQEGIEMYYSPPASETKAVKTWPVIPTTHTHTHSLKHHTHTHRTKKKNETRWSKHIMPWIFISFCDNSRGFLVFPVCLCMCVCGGRVYKNKTKTHESTGPLEWALGLWYRQRKTTSSLVQYQTLHRRERFDFFFERFFIFFPNEGTR